ncbi:MAG: undecaprenyl-diphosphatase UppP [Anaerolineales bacterium]|nr:undecaprenyl-diphosphatase UppP [Anaerolineales bacterium]
MTLFQAFVLGVVQGLTEFIPVSSSGHLVLVPWLLKWDLEPQAAFMFDVLVQWGTLLAVIVYFWKDLKVITTAAIFSLRNRDQPLSSDARLAWLVALSTIPALFAGLLLKSLVEDAINSPRVVFIFLLITGALLFFAEKLGRRFKSMTNISNADAIWIGVFQIFSLFPGVSRSGVTISAGIFRGIKRDTAARFSFLMVVPIMIAAGIIALIDLATTPDALSLIGTLIIGFIVAAIVGYISIHWLLKFLSERSLYYFSGYCLFIGLMGILAVGLNA